MRETPPLQPLQFVVAGKSIQHPQKAALKSTNADAFAADQNVIGIADGVSTVEDEGLDPSELPAELLGLCLKECRARSLNSVVFDAEAEESLHACDVDVDTPKLPLYILTKASVQCKSFGSTTCVLALLDDCRLWSVSIGDSQLLVLRRTDTPPKAYPAAHEFSYTTCHDSRGRVSNPEEYGGYQVVYRTVSQQHFFNCPFQFARMPDTDCSGEAILRRTAQTADVGSVVVHPGDIVVLGTDGLFDNLFDDDVLELVNKLCWADSRNGKPPKCSPSVLVDALLERAVNAGQQPPGVSWPVVTPFSKAAFDEVGRRLVGGKPDDITAVVAYIVPSGETPNTEMQQPLRRGGTAPLNTQSGKLRGQKSPAAVGRTCLRSNNSCGGNTEGSEKFRGQPRSGGLQQAVLQRGSRVASATAAGATPGVLCTLEAAAE
ncbi:T-cell activation protein phosphatase 2C, putative [Eimeria maxima]|uniref:Protein phosphatase n=1 Tax=Eimeria maxima TaxID=5804 RepID=U6M5C8_EIMMA|nr:T-cell activation protein phosphatase 2C, putative [Eimeria maxima]CDJ56880.1 T-cell activation protein phosphatase 2C, putative [Eimeria maxima]